jgi:hypothetical protein
MKNKKKLIIIVIIAIVISIGIILVYKFRPLSKKEQKQVVNEYGTKIKALVQAYLKNNKTTTNINYDKLDKKVKMNYEVYCEEHTFYNDGCIYLANCNINGKSTNYTYGTSRQKITEDLKPILYLYPDKEENIKVSFNHPEYLETTYPKFNKEWNVLAKPNGSLYDNNGKYYYALYWDEIGNETDFKTGFYVDKEEAIKFLEDKLNYIGLNDHERNEFIMYWLPILENNDRSLVYFELTDEVEAYNKINISPKPDSLLRVIMHVKKVNSKVNIPEEKLEHFNRNGFVAVEWGGVNYE